MSVRKVRRPQRPRATPQLLGAIGQAIRAKRLALDMTQLELAEAAGVHVVLVSRIENGVTPTLATVEALARALGERPSELLARAEKLADEPDAP
jgi:transcriptional regulator with XRE-family HTH domain